MKFADVAPSDDELRILLEIGFILREMGNFDDAAAVFRGANELLPSSDVPLVGLGTVEFQQRKFEQAHEAYDKALQLRPDSLYARVHRAEAWLFEGDRERAEEELRDVIKTDPQSPHSRTAQALLDVADVLKF